MGQMNSPGPRGRLGRGPVNWYTTIGLTVGLVVGGLIGAFWGWIGLFVGDVIGAAIGVLVARQIYNRRGTSR